MFRRATISASIFGVALVKASTIAQAAAFFGLGHLPYPDGVPTYVDVRRESLAAGVSADGSVVVGTSAAWPNAGYPDHYEAFRWRSDTGLVGLAPTLRDTRATAVSADGSVVVGSPGEGFRWTDGTGIVGLGNLPGPYNTSPAYSISADGKVIVGEAATQYGPRAYRWTEASGMAQFLDATSAPSSASGVSADGSVIVGYIVTASGIEAFRWTSASTGATTVLGDLPGGVFESKATAISADGTTVVGWRSSESGTEAFRWTDSGGLEGLGDLPDGNFRSIARGVSGDGSIVVGDATTVFGASTKAFIWDELNGMRSLETYLIDLGVDLAGWHLDSALAISADGTTIVGYGGNPFGRQEAWVARINAVPEPPTYALVVACLSLLGLIMSRSSRARHAERTMPWCNAC